MTFAVFCSRSPRIGFQTRSAYCSFVSVESLDVSHIFLTQISKVLRHLSSGVALVIFTLLKDSVTFKSSGLVLLKLYSTVKYQSPAGMPLAECCSPVVALKTFIVESSSVINTDLSSLFLGLYAFAPAYPSMFAFLPVNTAKYVRLFASEAVACPCGTFLFIILGKVLSSI